MPSEIHADIGSSDNQNPLLLYGELTFVDLPEKFGSLGLQICYQVGCRER
jgi:hypothetical protein